MVKESYGKTPFMDTSYFCTKINRSSLHCSEAKSLNTSVEPIGNNYRQQTDTSKIFDIKLARKLTFSFRRYVILPATETKGR